MTRWLALLPLVALVALGLMFGLYSLNRDPQVNPEAMVGKPMPQLTLPRLNDGAVRSLAEAAGAQPVLVNFFASWCPPCEVEHPVLMEMAAQGIPIVGVAYKDAPPQTQAFRPGWAIPSPSIWWTATGARAWSSASPACRKPISSPPTARSWPSTPVP